MGGDRGGIVKTGVLSGVISRREIIKITGLFTPEDRTCLKVS